MYVLGLCQKECPNLLPPNIGNRLGDGADGEVLFLKDDPSKVIKFSILYERDNLNLDKVFFKKINKTLDYLSKNSLDTYAKVFEYKYLGQYERKVEWGNQKYIMYYYIMERLYKLTEDEYKVLHTLISHEDKNIKKNFSPAKIEKMLEGLSRGLDFNAEKVMFFCNNFKKVPIIHHDIHVRNVLKDEYGNFKMIDFDRAQISVENL